jgi:hypothetical protein
MATASVQHASGPLLPHDDVPPSLYTVAARFVDLCNQGKNSRGLSSDRPISARLWHDALSFK